MKNKTKCKLFLIPALLLSFVGVTHAISSDTGLADDFTNDKKGTASKIYSFGIGSSDNKQALGQGSDQTNMTWEQWLNINASGFNTDGYYVVTTSGGSSTAKNAYSIKYDLNKPYTNATCSMTSGTLNTDFVYTGSTVTTPTPTCTGYTFNGWYTSSSGETKFNSGSTTVTQDYTLYAQWTANELNFNDQTIDIDWSSSSQTKSITGASNGTGTYEYSFTGTTPAGFSIEDSNKSNGTITISAGHDAGVYKMSVKAVDKNSNKEKTVEITIRIKPTLVDTTSTLEYMEKEFSFAMNGLKSGTTASSNTASLTLLSMENTETKQSSIVGFTATLNNGITSNTEMSFSVTIDNYTWSDYKITITNELKVLNITDSQVIYNTVAQKPNFYTEKDTNFQNSQNEYFDWKLCDKDGSNCTDKGERINAGQYIVKIQPNSSYKDKIAIYNTSGGKTTEEISKNFIINPFTLTTNNTTVTVNNYQVTYSGSAFEPNVTVETTINGQKKTLTEKTDYVVTTEQSILNNGTYNISIQGIGNYTGKLENIKTIEVKQKEITDETETSGLSFDWTKEFFWTGSDIEPTVIVTYNNNALVAGTDYDISYSNNKDVNAIKNSDGKYSLASDKNYSTITITGKGNFSGTKVLNFLIVPNEFSITETAGYAIYSGEATDGGAKVQVNNDVKATIKYGTTSGTYNLTEIPKYTDVGTYTVYYQITAEGYATKNGSFLIQIDKVQDTLKLSKTDITLTMPTAETITATTKSNKGVTSQFVSGNDVVDIKIDNENITLTPKKAGNAQITIITADTTNYVQASSTLYVTVKNGEIKMTKAEDKTVDYDGNSYSLDLAWDPRDASIKYSWEENGNVKNSDTNPNFTNAGSYLISYSISKDYYNSYYGNNKLTIKAKSLTDAMVTLDKTEFTYDGTAQKPTVTVKDGNKTLTEGTDYQVSYENNVMPTENAKAIITGIGNYQGKVEKKFTIKTASIRYTVTNGLAGFTGYATSGKDPSATGCTADTCSKANVAVTFPESSYEIAYSSTEPKCQDGTTTCSAENKNYTNGNTMPRFTDVGTHTVWFRIMATGYKTEEGTLTITITKRRLEVPELFGDYIYTGQIQSPSWLNYNSHFMKMSGDLQATNAGTYNVTFSLTDTKNTEWATDTEKDISDKTVPWTISKVSIKDHELVVQNDIAYNEIKQLYVSDGRVTFDRTGYNQIAWVEACEDELSETTNLYDRNCNYSKYTMIKAHTTDDTDETSCKNNGGTWIKATNTCQKQRLNYYDTSSSFSGMYIADYLNYDTSKTYDLYAVWSKVTYRIEYDLCDAKGCGIEPGNPTIVSYDSSFIVTNPTRVGYLFMGWEITDMDETPHVIGEDTTTEKSYTVPEEWIGTTQTEKIGKTVSMKNLTSTEGATVKLKAIWQPIKYNIIFDRNKDTYKDDLTNVTQANTSGNTPNMLNIAYDTTVALNKNKFVMNGYDFTGWSTTKDNKKLGTNETCTVYNENVNAADILSSGGCLSFKDEQKIQNLTVTEGDTITFYAQWKRNTEVKFTVTYWKQKIGAGVDHNSDNYSQVGVETYTGTADSLITLNPYTFKGTNKTENQNKYYINISVLTKNTDHASVSTKSGTTPVWKSTTMTLTDDMFRGFTLQSTDSNEYNVFDKVSCQNTDTTSASCSNSRNAYSFILNPNGTLNINVYYLRNTYTITYWMDGGSLEGLTTNNDGKAVQNRKYQVSITFQNPQGTNLKDGENDDGSSGSDGTKNSGTADFAGWYSDENVSVSIIGENGEVTTDTDVFAKWLQYRYSGANNDESKWTTWGTSNE